MDLAEWLRGLGLEQYAPAFRENDIDGEVLRRLTAEDARTRSSPAPPETAAAVAPGEAERRQLTVMFCDLDGSTALVLVSGEAGIGKSRLAAASGRPRV